MALTGKPPMLYVLSANADLTDLAYTGACRIKWMSFWNGHATQNGGVQVQDGLTATGQMVLEIATAVNVPFYAYYGEKGLPMSTGIFVTFTGTDKFPHTLIIQLA